MVRLTILKDKGQGLVLTRNVTGGEKVVAERPLISFRCNDHFSFFNDVFHGQ